MGGEQSCSRPWLALRSLNRVQPVYIVEAPWNNHSFGFCFDFTKFTAVYFNHVRSRNSHVHFLI